MPLYNSMVMLFGDTDMARHLRQLDVNKNMWKLVGFEPPRKAKKKGKGKQRGRNMSVSRSQTQKLPLDRGESAYDSSEMPDGSVGSRGDSGEFPSLTITIHNGSTRTTGLGDVPAGQPASGAKAAMQTRATSGTHHVVPAADDARARHLRRSNTA